jgi:histone H4
MINYDIIDKMSTVNKKKRGKDGKGLGVGGAKRHKKVFINPEEGIKGTQIHRLGYQAGVLRMEKDTIHAVKDILEAYLKENLFNIVTFTENRRGKQVLLGDVVNGIESVSGNKITVYDNYKSLKKCQILKSPGRNSYGSESPTKKSPGKKSSVSKSPKKSTVSKSPKKSTVSKSPKKSTVSKSPKKSSVSKSPKKSSVSKSPKKSPTEDAYMVDYSDKSVAVLGNSTDYRNRLLELGGKYNRNLNYDGVKQHGWIFTKNKKSQVEKILES